MYSTGPARSLVTLGGHLRVVLHSDDATASESTDPRRHWRPTRYPRLPLLLLGETGSARPFPRGDGFNARWKGIPFSRERNHRGRTIRDLGENRSCFERCWFKFSRKRWMEGWIFRPRVGWGRRGCTLASAVTTVSWEITYKMNWL